MDQRTELLFWVIIATITAIIIIYKKLNQKDMNSGLVLLLIAQLYLIHYFGAVIHTFPWYTDGNVDLTLKGFRLTVIGVISFVFASLLIAPHIIRLLPLHRLKGYGTKPTNNVKKLTDVGLIYFGIGIVCIAILIARLLLIPTIGGLISAGILLSVAGACFLCLRSIIKKDIFGLIFWISVAFMFPVITIVFSGHIGFGLVWLFIVVFFVIKYINPKRKLIFFGFIVAYIALSVFQTYMRDRNDLRDMLRAKEEKSLIVDHVKKSFSEPELFSPFDSEHLFIISARLNQNELVGEGIDYMGFRKNYVYGETLINSFLALVPRILWPQKPIHAGDDDYVFVFTGKFIPDDTSIGLGYVLELYGNFSTWGVVVGFFLLGIFLSVIDYISAFHLRMGNWQEFAIWFLPATAFTNAENVIATLVSTAALTLIAAYGASKIPTSLFRPVLLVVSVFAIIVSYIFIFTPMISEVQIYFQIFLLIIIGYFGVRYFLSHYRKKPIFRK